ncbi:MAG: PTS fructose transporter subunit IIA [Desulfamplus sp.]|nr:PTS fructose transporter subunit IIA [Desulfamplus sp.]MBF0209956.1 PTS fructose transporter subunit IIA [Desulfamplus sp.]MBF0241668.1 PTS fructose transporter subunit IIA [Desulfamplus sp.]
MTGILIVTHANLGEALIEAIEFIVNEKIENIIAVSIDIKENPEVLRNKIKKAINKIKSDKGVIIFTDMFGGTPSNLSYSFLEEGSVEVISGVNLPTLLKAIGIRHKMDMSKAVEQIVAHGKKSISLASGILRGEKRE